MILERQGWLENIWATISACPSQSIARLSVLRPSNLPLRNYPFDFGEEVFARIDYNFLLKSMGQAFCNVVANLLCWSPEERMGLDEALARLESLLMNPNAKSVPKAEAVIEPEPAVDLALRLGDGTSISVPVNLANTVRSVKETIEKRYGHAIDAQRLIWNGRELLGKSILRDFNIAEDTVVQLVVNGLKKEAAKVDDALQKEKVDALRRVREDGENLKHLRNVFKKDKELCWRQSSKVVGRLNIPTIH